jgi:hypothetical protein
MKKEFPSQCKAWIPDAELPEFERSYAVHSSKIMACTEEFLVTIEAIRKAGDRDAEDIWNAGFHVNIVAHDLLGMIHILATSKDLWARKTIGRYIAVLLYEAGKSVPKLFGKPYREACERLGFLGSHRNELDETGKVLSIFCAQNESYLKSIRNAVGAHKDEDPFEVVKIIAYLDLDRINELGLEFYEILKRYGATGMKGLDEISRRRR